MKKSITKTEVIKALQKEPLQRGSYFYGDKKSVCKVCAVGAVLRAMSFEKWARKVNTEPGLLGNIATNYAAKGYNPKDLLDYKNYLGALSCYFEAGNSKAECITFVKKYFPSKLTLTIDKDDL